MFHFNFVSNASNVNSFFDTCSSSSLCKSSECKWWLWCNAAKNISISCNTFLLGLTTFRYIILVLVLVLLLLVLVLLL